VDVDRSGYDDFFRQHFLRLVLFVMKLGAGRDEAEDAAQEAMCRAYRFWNSIESPSGWVRVVAERVYLSSSVRAKKERNVAATFQAADAVDPLMPNDETGNVLSVLVQLPYWQRKVMAWHYDGYTIREIAEITGKPESTIRSHLRHARDRLRLVLPDPGRGDAAADGGTQ
jgi:RNA polymerase sigma-70 factor (ECF subfamily)